MSLLSRLMNVWRADRVAEELDEELQFHLGERIRRLVEDGMAPDDAAREARRRFGSPLRLREESRDVKLLPWLDSLLRDLSLGLRMARKHAVVTAATVLSVALALGGCLAAFALVDALMLRPLPVRQPEQLVYLTFPTNAPDQSESETFNDPAFLRLRTAGRGLVDLFAMSTQVVRPVILDGGAEKEPVRTQYVSGDAFERLGVGAAVGRAFTLRDDDSPGSHPVAVVSHAYWVRRLGSDPSAVGRSFTLEGRPFEIVGVIEAGFEGVEPGRPTDIWLPYAMYNPHAFGNASFNWFRIFGRVSGGVALERAQSALQVAFTGIRRDRATTLRIDRPDQDVSRFITTPLYLRPASNGASPLRAQFGRALWILGAIAGLVLLVAGSNVVNLALARAAAREREMALRMSIGAGRGRLMQQVLIESSLVALAACLLGLLVASAAAPAVVAMLTSIDDPVQLDLRLDGRLALFSSVLALVSVTLFGLAPALRAFTVTPGIALKTGGRASTGPVVMRLLVAGQVAFGLVVLFIGCLLVLSFARLSTVNPGFAADHVFLLAVEPMSPLEPRTQRTALLQVLDRLREVPGVQVASSAEANVLGRAWTHYVRRPGSTQSIEATMVPVTDGYFETLGIPVIEGRGLLRREVGLTPSASIVVNQAFAARYYGPHPALGRFVEARFDDGTDTDRHEVVGVVADTRHDLRKPAAPTIYIPLRIRTTGTIHVRVAGDAAALAPRLRDVLHASGDPFRVVSITRQTALIDRTLLRERLLALLAGFFAAVGLVLVGVGLYGVLSFTVVERTREIGIRLALGAPRAVVVRGVLAGAAGVAVAGAAVGIVAGTYVSRSVEALLFEVKPLEFWSLAAPLSVFVLTAILAASLPAIRASRIDPAITLRND